MSTEACLVRVQVSVKRFCHSVATTDQHGSLPRVSKSTRTVLLVLLGLFGFGCLGTSVISFFLVRAVDDLGGSSEWSEDALPERELPAVFGVRLKVKPLRYQSRSMGFQDDFFEVLVQLPPDAAEAFLSTNRLTRGPEAVMDPDVVDQLRAFDPMTPSLKATTLELPEAVRRDGGSWPLHRSGELLEAPGVTWLHLTAFET